MSIKVVLYSGLDRAIILLVALPLAASSCESIEPAEQITLQEVDAWTLPEGFVPAGATYSEGPDGGTVVLWSGTAHALLAVTRSWQGGATSSIQLHIPQGIQPIAAALRSDGGVEIVTDAPPKLHVLSPGGAGDSTTVLSSAARIVDVKHLDGRWIALVEQSDGQLGLWSFSDRQSVSGDLVYGPLGGTPGALMLTEMHAPYRTFTYGEEHPATKKLEPPLAVLNGLMSQSPPSDSVGAARWISLPVIALGAGYIQTLADVTSDRRALLLYDSTGSFLRSRLINVALGFVGSSSTENMLIALRRTDRNEIVWYSWGTYTESAAGG